MVYLLALHAPALQMNTTKFKQDFIGLPFPRKTPIIKKINYLKL